MAKDKEGHGSENRAQHGNYEKGTHYHAGEKINYEGVRASMEKMLGGAQSKRVEYTKETNPWRRNRT